MLSLLSCVTIPRNSIKNERWLTLNNSELCKNLLDFVLREIPFCHRARVVIILSASISWPLF